MTHSSTIGAVHPKIAKALTALPGEILDQSGGVFYSGRDAFSGKRDLYVLGLNPGGSPVMQAEETVERDLAKWFDPERSSWSAYLDARWGKGPQGSHGIQPRLQHMFDRLKMDLRQVPASNVVFVRTPSERALADSKARLLRDCWQVHQAVIDALDIRVIVALGGTAGRWVRDAIGAHREVAHFEESNRRRWRSVAHQAADGRAVVTTTHPGRANWRSPAADPSDLVREVIALSCR